MDPLPVHLCLYVLELEEGKYYVGTTSNLNYRLAQHWNKQGAKWTQKYRPVKVFDVVYPLTPNLENETTLQYMRAYGWENVRGGSWCKEVIQEPCILRGEHTEPSSSDAES